MLTPLLASPPTGICTQQPQPLVELPATPVPTALLQTKHEDDDYAIRPTTRPPSLKPLDLGASSLITREPHRGRRRSSLGHPKRPSISAPHSFRRLDTPEGQRQSLVPLALGPVVLRQSPVPPVDNASSKELATRDRSDSTQALLSDERSSNHQPEDTPRQCRQTRRHVALDSLQQDGPAKSLSRSASAEGKVSAQCTVSAKRSSSSLRRDIGESTLFPSKTTPTLKRKGSFQMRKPFSESGDIDTDKEVLELNTIVEERRAEAAREKHGSEHQPAIAPSMQVHARSETLDAIGSALGRPFSAQANHKTLPPLQTAPPTQLRRATSTSSRVSGWLSNAFLSHSVPHLPIGEPFYKCRSQAPALLRTYSDGSVGTSLTEIDSPSLTAASSPTSKGHSRSQTGDSRITPLSPAYGGEDNGLEKPNGLPWPTIMTPTSQVGMAL